jgi:hypothetical protein
MGVGGHRHAPAALPLGKSRYPMYRMLGWPQGRSGQARKISPLPGFDPRTDQQCTACKRSKYKQTARFQKCEDLNHQVLSKYAIYSYPENKTSSLIFAILNVAFSLHSYQKDDWSKSKNVLILWRSFLYLETNCISLRDSANTHMSSS